MITKSENDLYFDKLQNRYYKILVHTYEKIIDNANDKEYSKVFAAFAVTLSDYGNQNPYVLEIIENFKHIYKLGLSIDNVLKQIPALREKHLRLMEEEQTKNKRTQYHYKNKFREFLKLPSLVTTYTPLGPYIWNPDIISTKGDKIIIKILIKHFVIQRFFKDYLETDLELKNNENLFQRLLPNTNKTLSDNAIHDDLPKQTGIKWIGQNKTEFVQLIYSLYHAELITNETKEITKLVVDIANFFNIDLGNNWQSNLSKSKNDRNNDYIPQIFDRIKNAFIKYSKRDK